MAKTGPKLKLTPETQEKICNEIKRGLPVSHAAELAGITQRTYYNWYNKGKNAKSGRFKEFYNKIEEAKAYGIALRVENIRKAGESGTWQADAWWLERMDPDNFSLNRNLHVNADVDARVGLKGLRDVISEKKKE